MIYKIDENNMGEWKAICKEFAKKTNSTLLFVNDTSLGIEDENGNLRHIYIDELLEMLGGDLK